AVPGTVETEAFLAALYSGAEDLSLCLFSLPGEHCHWFSIEDTGAIARIAVRAAATADVYFGIGLHRSPPASGRGEAPGVACIPGLWVDIDRQHLCHAAQNLPRSVEEVQSLLSAFPYPPSWLVDSGH